ncbi:hypothetical protein GLAREA_03578 [Glarea lozoyensis ATCC 20868]|uniref:Uncharacterized protein n=1 Tax=Glarea lozoyensis (strain ATCC 20868 / MF5171) TaxID=1116229 RepID=S3DF51_GLAL2|nr:uncharacterized protein GLAREA_03578 [Glarea lozoyensis ATCC 20868]EPE30611.1 hypothetical protein GLAREA_03578 [Glarea lozoyensis ATCC 20868]
MWKFSSWTQRAINISFIILLVFNSAILTVLWYNPATILENQRFNKQLFLNSQSATHDPKLTPHTYMGPIRRTFFSDLLKANNIPVKEGDAESSLLKEAKLPYNVQFVYVKEIGHDHLTPFGLSMVHQLHCLRMLNDTLHELTGGTGKRDGGGIGEHGSHAQHRDFEHLEHCVDYIAQALTCAGDDTLEPSHLWDDPLSGKTFRVVDGTGTVHQCRDTKQMQKAISNSYKKPIPLLWEWEEGATLRSVLGDY